MNSGAAIATADGDAVWGAVLAAGAARRLGRPKALLALGGQPLVARAARALLDASLERVLVVVGHQGARVASALEAALGAEARLELVPNPDHARGLGTSLAVAARRALADDRVGALVVVPCDLPFLDAAAVARVVQAWREARARGASPPAVRSVAAGRPAHPVLLARTLLPAVARLEGDRGAGPLLRGLGAAVRTVEQPPELALDVDTAEDWAAVLRRLDREGADA